MSRAAVLLLAGVSAAFAAPILKVEFIHEHTSGKTTTHTHTTFDLSASVTAGTYYYSHALANEYDFAFTVTPYETFTNGVLTASGFRTHLGFTTDFDPYHVIFQFDHTLPAGQFPDLRVGYSARFTSTVPSTFTGQHKSTGSSPVDYAVSVHDTGDTYLMVPNMATGTVQNPTSAYSEMGDTTLAQHTAGTLTQRFNFIQGKYSTLALDVNSAGQAPAPALVSPEAHVPEPGALFLLSGGLAGLAGLGYRSRRALSSRPSESAK